MSDWPADTPARLLKKLEPFTRRADGIYIWYRGGARYVCGARVSLEQIPSKWSDKRKEIDAKLDGGIIIGAVTYAAAVARFYQFLDHRIETGLPEPLAEATRMDYERSITLFGKVCPHGPDTRVASRPLEMIGADDFTAFAKTLGDKAPSTLARHFSYLHAFFKFCVDEGLLERMPQWGRYFAKPTKQQHLDVRLRQRKSFTPTQIQRLYFYASLEEKIWILLGINGAFDNSDLANLTYDVMDRQSGIFDYRRRKKGLMPRIVPIRPEVWSILELYRRPAPIDPADADKVFLTPEGHPLARVLRSKSGKPHRPDYVAMRWTRLMRRAGIRPASKRFEICSACGLERPNGAKACECGNSSWKRREVSRGSGGDRRGFRSLRTTFSNFAPRQYRDELELIMGHAGGVLLENYLEDHGIEGLREVVDSVWHKAFSLETSPLLEGPSVQGCASASSDSSLFEVLPGCRPGVVQ